MIEYSQSYGKLNYLHFHDGSTCHGAPTLKKCLDDAVKNGWQGKILERTDIDNFGSKNKCYSLISESFEHHEKYGKFVTTLYKEYKITGRKT